MTSVRQTRLALGEDRLLATQAAREIARELETHPCPTCGEPVVTAHDATRGDSIVLDPGPRAYFVIGERPDGTPIVALTSNGIMAHRCTPRRDS